MRKSVGVLLLLAGLHGWTVSSARGDDARPSVLLLLADNWAWPHASAYGGKSVRTPTFDRIARNGVLFTNAFCQVPSCSPARAVLLTGQAAHRLEDAASLWSKFPDKFHTYPQLLQQHGYVAGFSGKGWGPGQYRGNRDPRTNPAGTKFDSFEAFLDAVPADKPFCFWLGARDPHQPWTAERRFYDGLDPGTVEVPPYLPDDPVIRDTIVSYYAEVQRFDHTCHEAMQRLERSGRLDNTIVIVAGDNGWQMPRGLANVYDMGTHVPMALQWPARVGAGQTCDAFVSFEDYAPTLLAAAGVKPPEDMTGRDFLPLVTGGSTSWPDEVFLERERHANVRAGDRAYPCRAIRTRRFLYIRNLAPDLWPAGDPQTHWAVGPYGDVDNTPVKKLMLDMRDDPAMRPLVELGFGKRPAEELYDLRKDPYEMQNVASNPAYAEAKRDLAKRVEAWMRATGDPRGADPHDPRFDRYPYYGRRTANR